MRRFALTAFILTLLSSLIGISRAATFGSVVQIRGHVADIALDEGRGVVYAANFTANRIEVVSMKDNSLKSPMAVAAQPSTMALSPDGRYLVVGHYAKPKAPSVGLTVIDLAKGFVRTISLGDYSVLAVAFGDSMRALVVCTDGVRLLDPLSGTLILLRLTDTDSTELPVPWATFPPEVIKASAGASGDGKIIYAMLDGGPQSIILRYVIATGMLQLGGVIAEPALGPRAISVDQTGATFATGWAMFDQNLVDLANFPYPPGIYNQGSLAYDWSRKFVYAQVAPGTIQANAGLSPSTGPSANAPLLHIADADNLTIREVLQLRENLAGKSLLTSNFQVMYSISDSGLTVFPVGSLQNTHRVQVTQGSEPLQADWRNTDWHNEDVVFNASACDRGVIRKYVEITDPGGKRTDFALSAGAAGVKISPSSGTTPAHVAIDVDLNAFQGHPGTTVVPIQISSAQAVNVPGPVRLLINIREPDQQGTVYNVPGTIVDVLTDPVRNRFYAIRQDQNVVLVFDATNYKQIAALRTGNTPVQMALTQDNAYLLVANDNSQYASVFDLNTLQPSQPILFPPGYYPRSIAVSSAAILATSRLAGQKDPQIHRIDFKNRVASAPDSLGIYENTIDPDGAVLAASPSGGVVFMSMPNGTVALYEAQSDTFVASRHDVDSLSGAYAALSDDQFIVDVHVLNGALVPVGQIDTFGATSSGVSAVQGKGLFVGNSPESTAGLIQRFDTTTLNSIRPVRTAESPFVAPKADTASAVTSATSSVQIGRTILPFTRTLAPVPSAQSVVVLSTSGFTVLQWDYDQNTALPPVVSAVTNAADGSTAVAPGGLISIYGSGFSASSEGANQVPLPHTLANACVSINNESVPLLYVSAGQINAQLPFDVSGAGSVVVRGAGGVSGSFNFSVTPNAPAVFRTGTAGPQTDLATVFRVGENQYSLATLSNPIHPEDTLVIYATGLGTTSPQPVTGDAAPADPLATVVGQPVVTLGGTQLDVFYAGLTPNEVGVYQINAKVPWWISTGMQLPLTISQGGHSTTVQLRVVKP